MFWMQIVVILSELLDHKFLVGLPVPPLSKLFSACLCPTQIQITFWGLCEWDPTGFLFMEYDFAKKTKTDETTYPLSFLIFARVCPR